MHVIETPFERRVVVLVEQVQDVVCGQTDGTVGLARGIGQTQAGAGESGLAATRTS
ncbi:MAG: hypothetical protein ACFHWZ_12715 [Phycisphaerales bacterium]